MFRSFFLFIFFLLASVAVLLFISSSPFPSLFCRVFVTQDSSLLVAARDVDPAHSSFPSISPHSTLFTTPHADHDPILSSQQYPPHSPAYPIRHPSRKCPCPHCMIIVLPAVSTTSRSRSRLLHSIRLHTPNRLSVGSPRSIHISSSINGDPFAEGGEEHLRALALYQPIQSASSTPSRHLTYP